MTKLCLNIGCGNTKIESTPEAKWINIDNNPICSPDVVRDIRRGLPFADDMFDLITCEHLVEHLECDDFIFLFNECWRVLKDGAELVIKAPYYINKWAHIDPSHKRMITEYSFDFFTNKDYNSQNAGVTVLYIPHSIGLDDGGGEITLKMSKTLAPGHYVFMRDSNLPAALMKARVK